MAIKSRDQITLLDMTDGYSVFMSSEAHSFTAEYTGLAVGAECSTDIVAFCGDVACSKITVGTVVCPTGLKATVTNNDSGKVTVTFTTTAVITSDCEATIPVTIDGITINKKFSISVAMEATPLTITAQEIRYQAGTSATTKPTGTWVESPPTVTKGQYLWTRVKVTYSDGEETESYSVAYVPKDGTAGTSVTVKSTEITYQEGTSGTTAPTGDWSETIPSVAEGNFLWTKTVVTYSDDKSTESFAVSYNAVDGAPAITMDITSDAGYIFKNNTGSATLTAHVYLGETEQAITDAGVCGTLGTVKWYKGTTFWKAAKSVTIAASDFENILAISAQLE